MRPVSSDATPLTPALMIHPGPVPGNCGAGRGPYRTALLRTGPEKGLFMTSIRLNVAFSSQVTAL
ncbi:hypothetical protein [Streptomyces clavuligerus]|uniref:hypothetical protein n=1 Tax=Streptomyces clavuligerus TaxID=1901 RepID=UPI0018D0CE13|nr:hypothetical protein [Streptomyces clavuligerus]